MAPLLRGRLSWWGARGYRGFIGIEDGENIWSGPSRVDLYCRSHRKLLKWLWRAALRLQWWTGIP